MHPFVGPVPFVTAALMLDAAPNSDIPREISEPSVRSCPGQAQARAHRARPLNSGGGRFGQRGADVLSGLSQSVSC
ncbi:hypothetical protein PAPYR_12474 [Paratrimastix pyriformis]|uniref:Uncharacterized protein n=1 Tax=Paratrimastix pyriformis TaxID=342808 RepID=A0ABQ8U1T9_9EUKA|nr:hypothetical protein PAPYR_12474 [Paratrimastix pyriformis]